MGIAEAESFENGKPGSSPAVVAAVNGDGLVRLEREGLH
jgi:hypothetical protein